MNIEEFREYCIAKPAVTEEFPFDEVTLVFKVAGKMFALTSLDKEFYMNLKCEPERAIELREKHTAIKPGWHMNKKHWNSVYADGTLKDDLIRELIDHSYELIVKSLTKKVREENDL
ncbi:MmcQ/YjbR family DNA-binding protein [Carboxylicivirga marina]|uniref:MmcQ/YjbR family DNA-binding protein n=1 Tax=Carboxylicivirga marina TaxID=2800988 RepID=A0ABS1HE31_9BACT|nr:MmcQ/YjbR family DNA-binding protein [Carboxylicivirga marina]MBK3515927.1 MmcQ/YjbR family DNA-binding protein [Carboxylicivirga marina]